jgi:hypothetical protein
MVHEVSSGRSRRKDPSWCSQESRIRERVATVPEITLDDRSVRPRSFVFGQAGRP